MQGGLLSALPHPGASHSLLGIPISIARETFAPISSSRVCTNYPSAVLVLTVQNLLG
eukprot:CAMPEP_0197624098 /NCGR_PEP_ID=MMETSP1338-20131121/3887_1 /TAXON_ID=43686 ORGANISM="Pelagodinium beii, Strain RCC1491" /NCGR_SAMPLE_ID=MMETSP1338 /ASSEMBLY_ACC=CAM_ASM_000754 /LENGTH=56 /DNA_ID=CAMNT_0043194195 /DNA_START=111 /DNA_END=277 /DNA_ORIENTATION=+